jgi:hypothetical protein
MFTEWTIRRYVRERDAAQERLRDRIRVLEEALTRIKDMPQRNWHDSPEIAHRALEQTDAKGG